MISLDIIFTEKGDQNSFDKEARPTIMEKLNASVAFFPALVDLNLDNQETVLQYKHLE